jgi:hypothetical protein
MKQALNLFSLFAFGLLVAGVLIVMSAGSPDRLPQGPGLVSAVPRPGSAGALDPVSLLVGIACGWVLSFAGRVPWLELPFRALSWLVRNERNILRLGMAVVLLAVVILY